MARQGWKRLCGRTYRGSSIRTARPPSGPNTSRSIATLGSTTRRVRADSTSTTPSRSATPCRSGFGSTPAALALTARWRCGCASSAWRDWPTNRASSERLDVSLIWATPYTGTKFASLVAGVGCTAAVTPNSRLPLALHGEAAHLGFLQLPAHSRCLVFVAEADEPGAVEGLPVLVEAFDIGTEVVEGGDLAGRRGEQALGTLLARRRADLHDPARGGRRGRCRGRGHHGDRLVGSVALLLRRRREHRLGDLLVLDPA